MKLATWAAALAALGVLASTALGQPVRCKHHCTTSTATTSTTTIPTTTGTSYLFDDEFNGTSIDQTKWAAKTYHDTNGAAYFDGWNHISESGGYLTITAVKNGTVWDSGFIAGRVNYTVPRHIEARAKVPCGYGTWAAPIWETGNGAPQFEDDVSEQLGREPQTYHSTLHYWSAPGVDHSSGSASIATGVTLCNGFHIYAADIHADHVDFYFDGHKVATRLASAIGLTNLATWTDHPNITLDMGGNWAGTPTISGPVSLLVDYVRVTSLP